VGLLQDFLSGGPLGLWPAVYLVTQAVVISQRSYFNGREQSVVWMGFIFASASAGFIFWLAMSVLRGELLPPGALALQLAMTVAAYPVLSIAFSHLHRRVIVEA
ncbi:MAG: rod shape-determining protein MreD, partial [Pseudomonadota bacterium]